MKRFIAAAVLSLLATSHAFADWDYEAEAREQRERAAAAREQAARDAAAKKIRDEAEAKANAQVMAEKRKYVGAAAKGRSDAEVDRLYAEKQASQMHDAQATMADAQRRAANAPAYNAQAVKGMTGYTMEEMQNMSPEQLDALERDLEKKQRAGQ